MILKEFSPPLRSVFGDVHSHNGHYKILNSCGALDQAGYRKCHAPVSYTYMKVHLLNQARKRCNLCPGEPMKGAVKIYRGTQERFACEELNGHHEARGA